MWQDEDGRWMIKCPECGKDVFTGIAGDGHTTADRWEFRAKECGHLIEITGLDTEYPNPVEYPVDPPTIDGTNISRPV